MSVAGISAADHTDKLHKKSFHRRNDSGELDVFEAARYFSGYNEALGYNGSSLNQKNIMMKDHHYHQDHRGGWRGGRISLDMPTMRNVLNPHQHHSLHHHQMVNIDHHNKQIKDKKYKQPSSPGGRLASFLNSLFNQSASKKKKSKSTTTTTTISTTQSMKDLHDQDQEISPGGGIRRKRRSSISHFRSSSTTTTTTTDSKSIYSSSSSGFRTPPPYGILNAQTPTKSYKDFRSFSDHKQVVVSNKNNNAKNDDHEKSREIRDLSNWLEHEKFKYCSKENKMNNNMDQKDKYSSEKKGIFRRLDEEEEEDDFDGADSDSSSDLFELQNYDLSSGLPVYETTNMDNIKRGAPISNAQL